MKTRHRFGSIGILLVCFGAVRAVAVPSTPATETLTTTESSSENRGSCSNGVSGTKSGYFYSGTFSTTPTPGNYRVTINSATFDDTGSVGGVSANSGVGCTPEVAGCAGALSQATQINSATVIPEANVTIVGNQLRVDVFAADDPACGEDVGWSNVSITWEVWDEGAPGGGAAGPGGPGGVGGGRGGGGGSGGGVAVSVGLGTGQHGDASGQVRIEGQEPRLDMAKPEGLRPELAADVERIDQSGKVRQLRTDQGLTDVVVINDFKYEMRFYGEGNFGTTKVGGLYPVTGAAFTTITVENPDAATNTFHRLRITEAGDLGNRQSDYTWTAGTQTWELETGSGARKETQAIVTSGSLRSQTNEVKNADGTVVFKQIEKYKAFAWGQTNLIERIVDPAGAMPQTNTWIYYETLLDNTNNYRQVQFAIEPSGHWQRFEYDAKARVTKTVTQFGNAATNAAESVCRVTTNSYSATAPHKTVIEYLLGQEIGRSYEADFAGGRSNIVCQTPGAAWTAADNLVTVTKWHTSGAFEGETKSVKQPDGTLTLISYALSADGKTKTTTNAVGEATADESSVTNGTRTITVVNLAGGSLTNTTYDIASGLLIGQSVTVTNDFLSRPLTAVSLAGTNTTSYSCCGVASTTDQEGITTDYAYDALRRVLTTTRAGITVSNSYDGAGRMVRAYRNGILQAANVYDKAGRTLSTTNALNYATTYSETRNASGGLVRTTTNPDGTTQIETYFQDGQLTNLTGTAVHGMRYEYGVEQDGGVYRPYTKETKLTTEGTETSEWTKTYTDMVGRQYKTVFADGAYSQSYFNNKGQLWKQRDPDGIVTLFAYNGRGELETTAIDLDQDDVIDYAGTDRITRTQNSVASSQGTTVRRTTTSVWTTDTMPSAIAPTAWTGSPSRRSGRTTRCSASPPPAPAPSPTNTSTISADEEPVWSQESTEWQRRRHPTHSISVTSC